MATSAKKVYELILTRYDLPITLVNSALSVATKVSGTKVPGARQCPATCVRLISSRHGGVSPSIFVDNYAVRGPVDYTVPGLAYGAGQNMFQAFLSTTVHPAYLRGCLGVILTE